MSRSRKRILLSLLITLVCAGMIPPVAADDLTADEIIARAIANREKITSYDIELTMNYGEKNVQGLAEHARFYRYGDQIRVDMQYPYRAVDRFPGLKSSHFWLRIVNSPRQSIVFCNIEGPRQRAITVDNDPDRTVPDWEEESRRYDLRSLGFQTSGPLAAEAIDCLFKLAATEKELVADKVNGCNCDKVSFDLESGVECDLWFAESLDYAPLRLRFHSPVNQLTWQVDLDVEEWEDSGLYFPVRYETTLTGGNHKTMVERGHLVIHSLNGPLPDNTFHLSGLEIPEGKSIQKLPSDGPAKIWNGEKIVLKRDR